jgi:hypothetical protein
MTERIDLVYDRLVADEKLKAGTKYERLAAIAFRILTKRTTLHDLRLRGEIGVAHQIDAVVGSEQKRILIEAKDYDTNVDLPVVRDFSAVVDDLQPDEAFVVTTVGFSPNAQKWAEAKGLKLAVLRPPEGDEDWGNLVRRIDIALKMSAASDLADVQFFVDQSEAARFEGDRNPIGRRRMDDVHVGDEHGPTSPFRELFEAQVGARCGDLPPGEPGELEGTHEFDKPTWLHLPGQAPIRISGFGWRQRIVAATHEFSIGDGIAGLAAELVLRTLDGSIHRIFTNRQIQSWTFDGKTVVPH